MNWAARDAQALRASRAAVRELLTDASGARRVSLAGVGQKIGMQVQLLQAVERLPQTLAYVRRATGLLHRWERRRLGRVVAEHLAGRRAACGRHLAMRASLAGWCRPDLYRLAVLASKALRRAIEYSEPFVMDWSGSAAPAEIQEPVAQKVFGLSSV